MADLRAWLGPVAAERLRRTFCRHLCWRTFLRWESLWANSSTAYMAYLACEYADLCSEYADYGCDDADYGCDGTDD